MRPHDRQHRSTSSASSRSIARVGIRSGYSVSYSAHRISPPALLARARSALELH